MDIAGLPENLAYLAVFVAAVVEGEVVLVAASVLVGMDRLNLAGVWIAGALGGAAGDQFYFFALRRRLRAWLARWPWVVARQDEVVARVRKHQTLMILACRFLPGLRIAIPVACAYAEVPPIRFAALDLISAIAWAGGVILVVAWAGPQALARLGLKGWWALALPATLVLGFFWCIGRTARTAEK
jgi:undecaprenyl-diphosphatase